MMSVRVLIGGIGYRWQRDVSFGLVLTDRLARLDWPPGVEVADLGYGAIYVAQDLADAQPPYDRLILLAGVQRGRQPGRLYRYEWAPKSVNREPDDGWAPPVPAPRRLDPDDIQTRIREAGAGVIHIDHLLVIAEYFGALPDEVVVVEVEPVETAGGEEMSPPVVELLPAVQAMVRREAGALEMR